MILYYTINFGNNKQQERVGIMSTKLDITNAENWNTQYHRDCQDDLEYSSQILQWMRDGLYDPKNLTRETVNTRYYLATHRYSTSDEIYDKILCQDPHAKTRQLIAQYTENPTAITWLAYDVCDDVRITLAKRPDAQQAHIICQNDPCVTVRQYIAKNGSMKLINTLIEDPHEFVRWSIFDNPNITTYHLRYLTQDINPSIRKVALEILDNLKKIAYNKSNDETT